MKEAIEIFAINEFKNIQESKQRKVKSKTQTDQLYQLSLSLLALAPTHENNIFFQILRAMEEILDSSLQCRTVKISTQLWMLGRMAVATHLWGDKDKSNQLQAKLGTGIDGTLRHSKSSDLKIAWATAYLASLQCNYYENYREALRVWAFEAKPKSQEFTKEAMSDYLWTLTLNMNAAANAGQRSDFEDYITAFKSVSRSKALSFYGVFDEVPFFPYICWMRSILRNAAYQIQDLDNFHLLGSMGDGSLEIRKKPITNTDAMLASANQLLLFEAIGAEAAMRLAKRPEHRLPADLPMLRIGMSHYEQAPNLNADVTTPIVWQSYFQPVAAVHVLPKKIEKRVNPKLVWIYAHWNAFQTLTFTAHHRGSPYSLAKIGLIPNPSAYPDGTRGFIYVTQLSSHDPTTNTCPSPYRLGSLMMELAIRYSIDKGYFGKILVNSANNSGDFYLNVGLASIVASDYAELLQGIRLDGGEMYLPLASRVLWQQKIAEYKYPLMTLTTQKTVDMSINPQSGDVLWIQLIDRLLNDAVSSLTLEGSQDRSTIELNNFFYALNNNESLRQVTLQEAVLSSRALADFLRGLTENPKLETLNICHYKSQPNAWDDAAIEMLAVIIEETSCLKTISLKELNIQSEAFQSITNALTAVTHAITLHCENVTFSKSNSQKLQNILRSNPLIKITETCSGLPRGQKRVRQVQENFLDMTTKSNKKNPFSFANAAKKLGVFPNVKVDASQTSIALKNSNYSH